MCFNTTMRREPCRLLPSHAIAGDTPGSTDCFLPNGIQSFRIARGAELVGLLNSGNGFAAIQEIDIGYANG